MASRSVLTENIVKRLALQIASVTIAISVVSFVYGYYSFQHEALSNLGKYIRARSELESRTFQLAQTNTEIVRDEFIRRLEERREQDPSSGFAHLMSQDKDGVWRVRVELDDFEHKATVAILPTAPLTRDFKQHVLTAYEVVSQFGPAFRNRFYDTFIDLNVSDATVMFLPDLNYARSGSIDTFAEDLETELGATPRQNPERKTFWTGLYRDPDAKRWMVSVVSPIDDGNEYVGGAGQDVLLDELIERTNNVSLDGAYNLIMTRDGRLIAHPSKMNELVASNGQYRVTESKDQDLMEVYEASRLATLQKPFIETRSGDAFVGVGRIVGPDWMFVTVYPKWLLAKKAILNASMVFVFGLFILAGVVYVVRRGLGKDVGVPIIRLAGATTALARGEPVHHLPIEREDEFGELARDFDAMAKSVKLHRTHLEELVSARTAELNVRNQQLVESNAELARLNFEKNEFLGIAAHDLKNPVAGILGLAELIQRNLTRWNAVQVEQRLNSIQMAAHRIMDIIRNLLDINAIESGQMTLRREPVDVADVGQTMLEANQEAATAKQLELELVVEHSPMVEGDPLALKRVIDNLLSNAIKYSPPGRSVVLRVRQQGQDAVILVEDEGLGIPPGERDRLFVKFGRLSNKPTGGEHATGLGLSIVKELVESMGGWVDAANRPQQGAVFSVYLPVYTPKSTCDEA